MPEPLMTREQVIAWKNAWAAVNRHEMAELHAKTMERKLEELDLLYRASLELNWSGSSSAETELVRSRWLKLRKAYES